MDVTLLTPTADRPRALALCLHWVERMAARAVEHHPGLKIEWVIADGSRDRHRLHAVVTGPLEVRHLEVKHFPCPRRSFRTNLVAGLTAAAGDVVCFIEDDDWYHPEYLCAQLAWLQTHDVAGEGRAKYYNLRTRSHRVMTNTAHASLCQTGIRRGLVPAIVSQIRRREDTFVDIHLWKTLARDRRKHLAPHSTLSVGIKGLPGRTGIGMGHRMKGGRVDRDGSILRQWVGSEDAAIYESLNGDRQKN